MSDSEVPSVPNEEVNATEVLDTMGVSEDKAEEVKSEEPSQDSEDAEYEKLPKYAKQRLGRQEKRHLKETRELRSRIEQMEAMMSSSHQQQQSMPEQQPMDNIDPNNIQQVVQHAVNTALQHREHKEQEARRAEQMKYVHEQYQQLQEELDSAGEKYDDFDEVVKGKNTPFTETMAQAAMFLPKQHRADVLYKLGKNPEELKRISNLHPIDQIREMVNLSHVVSMGGPKETKAAPVHKPISPIKSMPVSPSNINEKTPISELRKAMKNW